jgi:hypothetical protein
MRLADSGNFCDVHPAMHHGFPRGFPRFDPVAIWNCSTDARWPRTA